MSRPLIFFLQLVAFVMIVTGFSGGDYATGAIGIGIAVISGAAYRKRLKK